MMEETFIMNHVKELTVFVSEDPMRDLELAKYGPRLAQPPSTVAS